MAGTAPEPASPDLPLRYWRAVADLPYRRREALGSIEACFREGVTPQEGELDGPYDGRLITTTFGYGLDGLFMGLTRLWMPWKGKSLDPEAKEGRNLFSREWGTVLRVLWRAYDDVREEGGGLLSTFRFVTWSGPSAYVAGVETLKIDYDHENSPRFMIRPILDEVVRIDEGLYLGQALMKWHGNFHRVAWFSLAR